MSRAGLRQISRLAKLRNECNKSTKFYPETSTDHELNPIHINEKINTILKFAQPISASESHKQCNKAIGTIVRQASNTLNEKLRDKENESYDKSPKHYHNNLKISAGLLPRARDQPRVTTLRHPLTITIHNTPQDIINIVTTHYTKEQQRATPNHLPQAPWTQPRNPDNYEVTSPTPYTTPHPTPTLDTYITRGHYDRATTRAPEGKAPGPVAINNELIKHLPESAHKLLYTIFSNHSQIQLHAKGVVQKRHLPTIQTEQKRSAQYSQLSPIALMNGILKLWTSILTNIDSPWAEAQGILSDSTDGFKRQETYTTAFPHTS
jgi:hypothetical protein